MKKVITIIVALFMCVGVTNVHGEYIFGVEKGMTIDDIRKLGFGEIEKFRASEGEWIASDPQKPEGAHSVMFVISEEAGLVGLGIYWYVKTNSYGDELMERFAEMQATLVNQYGNGTFTHTLERSSVWTSKRHFMRSLEVQDRTIRWVKQFNKNKWGLFRVSLDVYVEVGRMQWAQLILWHSFIGSKAHARYVESLEDSRH